MAYDSTTQVTDDLDDNLATYHNELKTAADHLMSASAYAAYTRTQSMTGNVTLTDSDFPVQSFSPTAARDLTLPTVASTNHPFYVVNRNGTYKITVKNSGGTVICSLPGNQNVFLISDGANGWYAIGDDFGSPNGGWIEVTDSWTYASANTINVPTDATTTYKKGIGIRLKQGGGYKYYYGTIVAATLLTVTGGTDYTVANAAITDVAYTLSPETAVGFPVTFNCAAPTWDTATIDNGTGGQQPTAGSQYFRIDGDRVNLSVFLSSSGAVKNGAGTEIAISNIPATLPSRESFTKCQAF